MTQMHHDQALIDATLMDDIAVMRRALLDGADVNARDPEHRETPLMLARSEAAVRLLLDSHAEVDACNDRGMTAFMLNYRSQRRRWRGIGPLLAGNRPAAGGESARCWRGIGPLLAENGAAIDARNADGETALTCAVGSGDAALVDQLLALGAVPELGDIDVAIAMGFTAIAERLQNWRDRL